MVDCADADEDVRATAGLETGATVLMPCGVVMLLLQFHALWVGYVGGLLTQEGLLRIQHGWWRLEVSHPFRKVREMDGAPSGYRRGEGRMLGK